MAKRREPSALLSALRTISVAQRDKGAPYQTHTRLLNGSAVAFDGVLAAGCMIEEDLNCYPHTHSLISALSSCSEALAITQTPTGRLSVRSGKFRAMVPCCVAQDLPAAIPDEACGSATNALRDAFKLVSPFVLEGAQRVVLASARLGRGSVHATNNHVIIEAWHGIDMPDGLVIPKAFITAVLKITHDIVSFGFSERTLTLHFADGVWLRTQLYVEKWPDVAQILDTPNEAKTLPEGFYEAYDHVLPFVEDNRIRIGAGMLQSHRSPDVGAVYEVPGLESGMATHAKELGMLRHIIETADFGGDRAAHFYGKNVRGVIALMRE